MSKYLEFILLEEKSKTQVYEIVSKRGAGRLGIIKWFAKWRQYTFFPEPNTIYNPDCLNDITDFIKELMKKHKDYYKNCKEIEDKLFRSRINKLLEELEVNNENCYT